MSAKTEMEPSGVYSPEQRKQDALDRADMERRAREKTRAKQRMTRIRRSLRNAVKDYAEAVRLRDWETLGFPTLEAWRDHILGYTGLTRAARLEIVGTLTEIGMSQREIAAATGASAGTVSSDQRAVVLNSEHEPRSSARQKAARDREASRRKVIAGKAEPAAAPAGPSPAGPVVLNSEHEPAATVKDATAVCTGCQDKNREIAGLKARVAELEELLRREGQLKDTQKAVARLSEGCPRCGDELKREFGTWGCMSCGWSEMSERTGKAR